MLYCKASIGNIRAKELTKIKGKLERQFDNLPFSSAINNDASVEEPRRYKHELTRTQLIKWNARRRRQTFARRSASTWLLYRKTLKKSLQENGLSYF
jgi:hypothetical protein